MGVLQWLKNKGRNGWLGDVSPALASKDAGNRALGDAEACGQSRQYDAFCAQTANRSNVVSGQFGLPHGLPEMQRGIFVTGLRAHVSGVVGGGTEEQMVGPDARAIVTGVQNHHPSGNGSIGDEPRIAMGAHVQPFADVELPVAVVRAGSGPEPTRFRLIDPGPETLCVFDPSMFNGKH